MPIPWEADAPSYGFGPRPAQLAAAARRLGDYALDRQRGVPGSTYELYRAALRLRRERGLGSGALAWVDGYGDDVVAFVNGRTLVVANLGDTLVTAALRRPSGHRQRRAAGRRQRPAAATRRDRVGRAHLIGPAAPRKVRELVRVPCRSGCGSPRHHRDGPLP